MDLKFEISKQGLFVTALLQNTNISGWVDLQDKLWEKYKLGYQLLQGNNYKIFVEDDSKDSFEKASEDIKLLIKEGMASPEFSLLFKNAQDYKKWLENEWLKNKAIINKELKDILRVCLPRDIFIVYVMGNLVHVGRYLGNHKIAWGHKENWPNYSLVYLAHECIHSTFSYSDLNHAIIELATDNELRIRLNRGGDYFICDGEEVGHDYLRGLEKSILSEWKSYLGNKSINIKEFIEIQKNKNNNTEK